MFKSIKKSAAKKTDAVVAAAQKVAEFDPMKKIRIAIEKQIN